MYRDQFSRSLVSNSLQPQGLQHPRPPCPSPTRRAYSNSVMVMPSNHLILCCPLLLLPSIFPSIRYFQMSQILYQVAKVLEFQLQHQSFQWTPRTDQGCIIYGHNWISLSNHNCCHGCTLSSKIPQMSSMSTDRGMDKEEVIHMYNGILLSH